MGKIKQPWFLIVICILLLGFTNLPYILGFYSAQPDHVFSGFFINPLDGNSYLSKMYEGYRGDWLFTLPYTAQVSSGTLLFFFYLLLGHLARLINSPLIYVFHVARAIASIIFVFVLADLIKVLFKDSWAYRFALIMVCFGSGMGWVAMPTGYVTSDFWVAEAYPFLSALVNPHFCLAGALMVWIIKSIIEKRSLASRWKYMGISLSSLIIGSVAPFGVVILVMLTCVLIIASVYLAKRARQGFLTDEVRVSLKNLLSIFLGGVPILIYEVYVIQTDPILRGWNTQNVTASPPIWDLLLSFSPLLILAIFGVIISVRQKLHLWTGIVAWLALGILFVYLPWSLQRRFLFGLLIPISLLAALAVQFIRDRHLLKSVHFNLLIGLLIIGVFTTNILIEMTTLYGIKTKDPLLYLTNDEKNALLWVEQNTPENALILASPQIGLFIPAHTGRRVIYGHPFETVNAEQRKEQVTQFFIEFGTGTIQTGYLTENQIDYIFWGPRERLLTNEQDEQKIIDGITQVYRSGEFTIYQVNY